jgi:SET domain-containing protein
VELRASRIHGWGVFARVTLTARRKIGELTGELVRLPQARRAVELQPAIYLVELSRRLALDCSKGNQFKHLNHHCTPNCYLRIYRRRIEVYTLRQVKTGEELTIDYGMTPHKPAMSCQCGAAKCRRAL